MSRALDPATKRALEKGDHRDAFEQVSKAVGTREDKLLEIEFLPPNHGFPLSPNQHYLIEGNAIAIPKVSLVRAFVFARTLLLQYRQDAKTLAEEGVLKASAVILLMDPEHLSAANTRKRLIKAHNFDADLVRKELYLIDSYLTSRLHRHTKSPTLWSHRRWLISCLDPAQTPSARYTFQKVIFVSAERHPRNYYAWCHGRDLLRQGTGTDPQGTFQLVNAVREWCFGHHDDVSGWVFLLSLLSRHSGGDQGAIGSKTEAEETWVETVRLTQSFRWRNESVWYFLWQFAGSSGKQTELEELGGILWEGREDTKVLDRAVSWMKKCEAS